MKFFETLEASIRRLENRTIPADRQELLKPLGQYLYERYVSDRLPRLNFICTHNSRRSQLAQTWAYTAAQWYGLEVESYSGGVEETAFNQNAIKALQTNGFIVHINNDTSPNPTCFIKLNQSLKPLVTFSKLFDHENNPKSDFVAVMTCSEADENCPFIPGAVLRLPLRYDDPKVFDNTPQQDTQYLERSEQIGAELLWVFRDVKDKLDR